MCVKSISMLMQLRYFQLLDFCASAESSAAVNNATEMNLNRILAIGPLEFELCT